MTLGYDPRDVKMCGKLIGSKEFKTVWVEWCDYRDSRGKPLNEFEADEHIKNLKFKSAVPRAIEHIQYAMDTDKLDPYTKPQLKTSASFVPPTKEDVEKLIEDERLRADSIDAFHFYESNGWKVGGNKMVNWKASIRGWSSRNASRGGSGSNGRSGRSGKIASSLPNSGRRFKGGF